MLEKIFGNKTAGKALSFIVQNGPAHPALIATHFKMARHPVANQLERFEKAGVLTSKEIGRSRVYAFREDTTCAVLVRNLVVHILEINKAKTGSKRPRGRKST